MEASAPAGSPPRPPWGPFRGRRFLTGSLALFLILAATLAYSDNPIGLSLASALCALVAALVVALVFELVVRRRNPGW